MKRKTSVLSCFFLLLLSMSAYGGYYGGWYTSISKDQMTGTKSAYANTQMTGPMEEMGFPYSDTQAWLGMGCDGSNEWVYVGFTTSPNLNNTNTADGYELIRTRVKWDDTVKRTSLIQNWGEDYIVFNNDKEAISNIAKSNTMLLELNWHRLGNTYFKFSLEGSSAALRAIRNECSE